MTSLQRSVALQTLEFSVRVSKGHMGAGLLGSYFHCFHDSHPQGYTPDRLPVSSCVTVPDLTPPNPARSLFAKVTKSLFGRRKSKSESGASGLRV